MIVKMKKVSLVVLDAERKESLKKLRKLGLVHLQEIEGQGSTLAAFKEASNEVEKALSVLEEIKLKKNKMPKQENLSREEASLKAKEIIGYTEKKKSLYDQISQDLTECSRLEQWGVVDPAELKALAEKNICVYLYEVPLDKYSLIGQESKTVLVNTTNKVARFLLVSETEVLERPSDFPPEAYAVPLPRASTTEITDDIRKARLEIARLDSEIKSAKKYQDTLKSYAFSLNSDIEFETVYSGMDRDLDDDSDSVKLAWITGYVPVDSMEKFSAACKENEWAYAVSDPSEDDPVPTKLKNNKIVSLIYPLTDFLDVTPGYNEFDISGWFLLFFCIFFAMIFADAGYGLLIALLGPLLAIKTKKFRSINALIILLGLCTCGWGALTCSLFGIPFERLPDWFVRISAKSPFAAWVVGADAANTNQKVFCFVLALIQLSIAHIKCFIRDSKSLRCLGDLGALLELWGMFYVVMNMVVDSTKYPLGITQNTLYVGGAYGFWGLPLPYLAIGVLLFGFALNFVFSNYEGSIGKSILESLKNIISVLLGIVNVFSDIVSYIRLWAVALAGAAISDTVNTMAGPMLGKAIMIAAVVLLVFGHGLNMVLNLLSVIVHGVRLNTLEFSQHLGMAWSGTKYRPFSEK